MGFGIRDDVLDVLSWSQLDSTSKELLCGNRGNARFLIVARFPRDAFAYDQVADVYVAVQQTVLVTRKYPASDLEFLQVRFIVVRFREDGENFILHPAEERRRVMPPALESAHFQLAVSSNCEKTIWHGHVSVLLGGKKDDIAIDGFDREWKARLIFNLLREALIVGMGSAFLPDVERVNQRVNQFIALPFGQLFGNQQGFPCHGIDGLMRFNLSKAGILIAGVAEAADEQPFHGVTLQFVSLRQIGRRGFLKLLECGALGDQTFDDAARDAAPFLADAVAEFRNPGRFGAAWAIHGFGRDVEARHDAWELADEIQFGHVGREAQLWHEDEAATVRGEKLVRALRIFRFRFLLGD